MSIPILTTTDPGSTSNLNVKFFVSTATPTMPSQRVTVAQYPASNPSFSRAVQVSSEYVFIKRGTASFAISLADLAGIAIGQVPALSYSPLITTQPLDAAVVAGGSNNAQFNVAANSETTLTYQWSANNGSSLLSNISNTSNNCGGIYSLVNATTFKVTPASNVPNSYSIYCTAYNATGNTATEIVTLTVT
jgi:hypothetical protein